MPDDAALLSSQAIRVLQALHERELTIATAESCTGGLIATLLTDQDGLGHCFDRGFITYTDQSKTQILGIEAVELQRHGAVSLEIAQAMAQGALYASEASIAISVTGFAGPARPHDEVGLVYLACRTRGGDAISEKCNFGPLSRERIRNLAAQAGLEMIERVLQQAEKEGGV